MTLAPKENTFEICTPKEVESKLVDATPKKPPSVCLSAITPSPIKDSPASFDEAFEMLVDAWKQQYPNLKWPKRKQVLVK